MSPKDLLEGIDRRTFLQIVSFTGITGLIYPRGLLASLMPETPSRVVLVEDSKATNGKNVDEGVVKIMVESGIKALTGQDDFGSAMKTLMPKVKPSSMIAIKVNCRYPALPSHSQVTYAVAEGIKQMTFDGTTFNENNIIIYDNWKCEFKQSGYTVNKSDKGVRCFDTDSTVGYSKETYEVNGKRQRLTKIVTELADYLINISVLKNHSDSGVTLCLKNNFGSCDNPQDLHAGISKNIPALNAVQPIREKQCLNIVDGLYGVRAGGPKGYPQFTANKILFSQDIVAADYSGRRLLEENGCKSTAGADHIDIAATDYHLGTNDPSRMDQVKITNPSAEATRTGRFDSQRGFQIEQNYPNPFKNQTEIRFHVSEPEYVNLSVFDPAGRPVRSLISRSLEKGWHQVQWDGCDDLGRNAAGGAYVCRLDAGRFRKAIIMQLA